MSTKRKVLICSLSAVVIILIASVFASIPPSKFPSGAIISIKTGTTLSQAAKQLADQGIIRSQFMYKAFVVITGESTRVMSGDYLFDQPQSVIRVAFRTAHGVQGIPKIRVTIPEGSDSKDIASILKKNIPGFDSTGFLTLASNNEGYLFPDTYFFYANATPTEVVDTMHSNFNKHIATLSNEIKTFGKPLGDIITMASIVEKEATSSIDRQIVAGILWKRLENNMPLQVDPPFFFFLNKTSDQLTLADLATDSPYNLYKHTGLPPTAIDDPGLDAILDTVTATTTKYFFYLSDKNGAMHYATDYSGHLANKEKYLR